MRGKLVRLAASLALVCGACGDDATVTADASIADGPTGDIDAPGETPDAPPAEDNETIETADDLAVGTPVNGVLDPAGDQDFYVFTATAGDWLRITTDTDTPPGGQEGMIDTVLRLFDGDGTLLAANDDGVPRVSTESELLYHVAATGTYYLEVLEFSEWYGDPEVGGPTFEYTLEVQTLVPASTAGLAEDPETGDDLGSASTAELDGPVVDGASTGALLGTFDDGTDVDVFTFTIAGSAPNELRVHAMPTGTTGHGSTSTPGVVRITDEAGTTTLASADLRLMEAGGASQLWPRLPGGTYQLWVSHPATAAGANDFYVLKLYADPGLRETEGTAGNDSTGAAETLTWETDAEAGVSFALVYGTLPGGGAGDQDYYAIDVATGQAVSAYCYAALLGSGLDGLEVTLRDAADAVQGWVGTETATHEAGFSGYFPETAGTYYLRVTAAGQDPMVTGDFYHCELYVITPASP